MANFRQIGRTELRTNLTERSAEPVRSTLAERSAEPFGFGRTLMINYIPRYMLNIYSSHSFYNTVYIGNLRLLQRLIFVKPFN